MKIQKRLRIPSIEQKLIISNSDDDEEELENDKTLFNYRIRFDKRIKLIVSYERNLSVSVLNGQHPKPTKFNVSPYDDTDDLKIILQL